MSGGSPQRLHHTYLRTYNVLAYSPTPYKLKARLSPTTRHLTPSGPAWLLLSTNAPSIAKKQDLASSAVSGVFRPVIDVFSFPVFVPRILE
ncbi:hypothetical protein SODALDRAFT_117363 [Sodiomyces alkalinus F11]|uniref:Uncharacterized protein n=1 Tax=Sodiomyces alkalinus (strain CBS 110278 / VKM F-3762 / F11) TaxID=1314773 RepID=A0A3N2Q3Q6_SODAK|nr:hypothetical protein SODALDRAFT_117363 [Sodiomyces alkalinus F11]ROT41346.1 hypothetical protein SODALDRAFT_117363 [Sodiomyces alkalinus F11]